MLLNIRFLCSGVRYDVLDNAFISRARFLFWEVLSFWLDVGDETSVEEVGGVGVEAARRRDDAIGLVTKVQRVNHGVTNNETGSRGSGDWSS